MPFRCVLFGNQGVGKSHLTYAWANGTYFREENSYILWMSATTVEKLYRGLSGLLGFIDHPDRPYPDEGIRSEVLVDSLRGSRPTTGFLFSTTFFRRRWKFCGNLSRQNGRGTIIFTTRTERVAQARLEAIEVPLLDVRAGVELFCGHFDAGKMDPSSAKIATIVMAVCCLPLAISHAGAVSE